MGIESDQVVYEYLSRVGDVAQQYQLPSATRMRLVAELRGEIDRRRAKAPVDSPAAVRRILSRLGSPDDVVAAAGDGGGAPRPPAAFLPVRPKREEAAADAENTRDVREAQEAEAQDARDVRGGAGRRGLRRVVPRPRPAAPSAPAPSAPAPSDAPSPPHLASAQELGDSVTRPDWWRVDGTALGPGESVPGFVGGVEIPDLLKPPPPRGEPDPPEKPSAGPAPAAEEAGKAAEEPGKAEEAGRPARRRRLPALPAGGWSNPLLLAAAALLVAGAVLGNWIALLLGWLIAYGSRRLTQTETKWAVMILPGLAVAVGVVWLWGRTDGRWGDPIADGGMDEAAAQTWPWVVRGAAVASALFLVWRSQRQR
ncbi:membrane protein [Streptomyces fumigatiscleroticus]|nr:membrane protein [Streptomyces fumigatiscleroticus]